MRRISLLTAACIPVLLMTCSREPGAIGRSSYFDLKQYVDSEIERLSQMQTTVVKTVFVNGKEERQTLRQCDFRSELAPLLDADINRPAWQGKYRADSTQLAEGQWTLTYTATDDKPPIRTLSVHFQNDAITAVLVERTARTLVAGSIQKLSYRPSYGFETETTQKVILMPAREVRIEIAFQ